MNQSVDAVAKNLSKIRENRSLSLDQLSELTGVSKSMLRQIETGKSSPTIATIWKIANGLKISFTTLLSTPHIDAVVRTFHGEKPLTSKTSDYRLFPLVPFEPDRPFETYYVEMNPGTEFQSEPHDQGNVNEYVFVTKGSIEVTVMDKIFPVNENEFIQFQANHPHKYRCTSDEMATAIMQISYF